VLNVGRVPRPAPDAHVPLPVPTQRAGRRRRAKKDRIRTIRNNSGSGPAKSPCHHVPRRTEAPHAPHAPGIAAVVGVVLESARAATCYVRGLVNSNPSRVAGQVVRCYLSDA